MEMGHRSILVADILPLGVLGPGRAGHAVRLQLRERAGVRVGDRLPGPGLGEKRRRSVLPLRRLTWREVRWYVDVDSGEAQQSWIKLVSRARATHISTITTDGVKCLQLRIF